MADWLDGTCTGHLWLVLQVGANHELAGGLEQISCLDCVLILSDTGSITGQDPLRRAVTLQVLGLVVVPQVHLILRLLHLVQATRLIGHLLDAAMSVK